MPATIYVTQEAYETAQTIKDMDYFQRMDLCESSPGYSDREGYHLKKADHMRIAPLPVGARFALLDPSQVSLPANLRGCIFEKAPDLPADYAEIVEYWSGSTLHENNSGAAYYQCPLNAYMVDLGADPIHAPVVSDQLLSEGIVVAIRDLWQAVMAMPVEDFLEIRVPIDSAMLGTDQEAFGSAEDYAQGSAAGIRYESIYLNIGDVLASPDSDRVFIDLLCNELIDYGYWY